MFTTLSLFLITSMAKNEDTLSSGVKKYLHNRYYNPSYPGAFSGPGTFFKTIKQEGLYKLSRKDIEEWLQSQDTFTVNRAVRHNFKRNRVIVSGIDDQWDADLIDLTSLAKYNGNSKYVLLLIDIFSRYVWTVKMKNKTSVAVNNALKQVLSQGLKPKYIRNDQGREFVAKAVQDFLKDNAISYFSTQNRTKANYAERAIKTIKSKLFKYMYANQTYKYIDELESVTVAYNKRYHSSIKMAPSDVNKNNKSSLWKQQYLPPGGAKIRSKESMKKFKFKTGDFVQISFLKKAFSREYDQKWSDEIFRVAKRFRREGLPVYKLKNFDSSENIQGTFYQEEIQKIKVPADKLYKIDKIISTKKVRGKRFYYVSWAGWLKQYNSYVSSKDIKHLKKVSL